MPPIRNQKKTKPRPNCFTDSPMRRKLRERTLKNAAEIITTAGRRHPSATMGARQDLSSGPIQDKGLIVLKNRSDDRDAVTAEAYRIESFVHGQYFGSFPIGIVTGVAVDSMYDSITIEV